MAIPRLGRRLTESCIPPEQADTTIQELYAGLVDDTARNEPIGCGPIVLV